LETYLLRHGIADAQSPTGRDSDRRLTLRGVGNLRRVVKAAHLAGLQPSLILSSPYVRAVESAQVAARLLKYEGPIPQSSSLTPDSSPAAVWTELRAHENERSILVVAHEPLLSATASWMLGSSRVVFEFSPGMMVRIDFAGLGPEPRGILRRMFVSDRP
jgi:phosphohistidine phosphatase